MARSQSARESSSGNEVDIQTSHVGLTHRIRHPLRISTSSILLQLSAVLFVLVVFLLENQSVRAMSKRFLKGFIMGAMFAQHHKP